MSKTKIEKYAASDATATHRSADSPEMWTVDGPYCDTPSDVTIRAIGRMEFAKNCGLDSTDRVALDEAARDYDTAWLAEWSRLTTREGTSL